MCEFHSSLFELGKVYEGWRCFILLTRSSLFLWWRNRAVWIYLYNMLSLGPPFSKKKINWQMKNDKETMILTGNSTEGGGGNSIILN
jgi:hypothetical protein